MGSRRPCCTRNVTICSLLVVGILCIIAGCVLIPEFPKIIRKIINKNIIIKDGSEAYKEWHKPTSTFYMNYYMFDLTNEAEVLNGKKPNVTQKGPYAYREIRNNIPIEWADDGNEMTYLQYKAYVFDKEQSCAGCTDNDTLTTPNVPMLALINETLTSNKAVKVGLSTIFNFVGVKLFHKLTVKQILFGYNDTLLMALRKFEDNPLIKRLLQSLKKIDPALAAKIPLINPFIQLQYNATAGETMTGNTTILTGKNDINKLQSITKWKGKSYLPYWNSSYGNMINGSDGTHFMPNPSKSDRLYMFVSDIYRSLYLNYDSDTSLKDIKLQKYTTSIELFQNASLNKENAAFCVPKCFDSGLLPIGQCLPMNPPIFMSGPHFYQGAQNLIDSIIGLHPNAKKHGTFLEVEPYTGIAMRAFKRLQANILISTDSAYIPVMQKTRRMVYPIMYIEEHGEISDKDADKFKKQVYLPIKIAMFVQYGLIGLGGLLILSAIGVGVCSRKKKEVINEDNNEKSRLLGDPDTNTYT